MRAFLYSPVGCGFDLLAVASFFPLSTLLLGFLVSCTSTSLIMQLFFYQAQSPKFPHELPPAIVSRSLSMSVASMHTAHIFSSSFQYVGSFSVCQPIIVRLIFPCNLRSPYSLPSFPPPALDPTSHCPTSSTHTCHSPSIPFSAHELFVSHCSVPHSIPCTTLHARDWPCSSLGISIIHIVFHWQYTDSEFDPIIIGSSSSSSSSSIVQWRTRCGEAG